MQALPRAISVRSRLEEAHAWRGGARARRSALDSRVAGYMSFTPSGRPYASLPVITPEQVRELASCNRRGLGVSLRSSSVDA